MSTYFINTIVDSWDMISGNTGNIIWHDKCKMGIDYDCEVDLDDIYNHDFKEEDVLCVPVANNLSFGETFFSRRLRKLHGIHAKIVLIGLGIQAPLRVEEDIESFVKNISGSKKRLFGLLSEKCVSIGVRGEITRQCLHKMGIKNVRVIGCPSFYSNLIHAKEDERIPKKDRLEKIVTNFSNDVQERDSIEKLLRGGVLAGHKISQILQNRDNSLVESEKINSAMFHDIDSWEEYIRNSDFDFSFGNRLHGNMIAYLNGVPALWVAQDARVKEVCDALKLSYVLPDDLSNIDKLEDLAHLGSYNDDFYLHRKKMKREYIQFLEENNVKHKFNGDSLNE